METEALSAAGQQQPQHMPHSPSVAVSQVPLQVTERIMKIWSLADCDSPQVGGALV